MQSLTKPSVVAKALASGLWPPLDIGRGALSDAIFAGLVSETDRLTVLAKNAILILTFALLIAGSAQLRIALPFTPVPITGQTFAVLLAGAALGSRRGFIAALAYIGMGWAGAPFFAGGKSGMFWKFTSAGYLVSYPFAAFAVGWLTERGWNRGLWLITSLLIGNVIIYAFGLPWLGGFIASNAFRTSAQSPLYTVIPGSDVLQKTLNGGLYPFIPGDLLKVGLAAATIPSAWGFVGILERSSHAIRRVAIAALLAGAIVWSLRTAL